MSTWEEEAFAEDAAAGVIIGGCVWPPRSYSCSFCKREFKSAQALGGHMNIHRRDRAKLKQSLGPHNIETHLLPQNHTSQFSPHGPAPFVSSPLSPSGYSPLESFSVLHGSSWSDVMASVSDSKAKLQKNQTKGESAFQSHEGSTAETDLSVCLNSVTRSRRNRLSTGSDDDDDDEAAVCFKRPKSVVFSPAPFFFNPCSQQRRIQPEVRLGPKPTSMDDIDLELRLGDLPKLK